MRKCIIAVGLLLFWAVRGWSQENSRVDLFGGYSFNSAESRRGIQNGWNGSLTYNVNSWLGISSDFSGHYQSQTNVDPKLNMFSLMFGPQFTVRRDSRLSPFAHVLLGFRHRSYEYPPSPLIPTLTFSQNDFASAFGGGFDIKLNRSISFRPFQADYLLEKSYGNTLNNFRFSTGIVFHVGGK
jgi:hypothetical protein